MIDKDFDLLTRLLDKSISEWTKAEATGAARILAGEHEGGDRLDLLKEKLLQPPPRCGARAKLSPELARSLLKGIGLHRLLIAKLRGCDPSEIKWKEVAKSLVEKRFPKASNREKHRQEEKYEKRFKYLKAKANRGK